MTQPMHCYYFSDETFAPKAAVFALHQHYKQCALTFKYVVPSDLAVQSIGHFGFFKNLGSRTLWSEVVDFFNAAALGQNQGRGQASDQLDDSK